MIISEIKYFQKEIKTNLFIIINQNLSKYTPKNYEESSGRKA